MGFKHGPLGVEFVMLATRSNPQVTRYCLVNEKLYTMVSENNICQLGMWYVQEYYAYQL